MAVGTCRACFKHAEVSDIVPDVPVCRACRFNMNKTLDFFAFYGYGINKMMLATEDIRNQNVNKETGEIAPNKPSEGVRGSKTPPKR